MRKVSVLSDVISSAASSVNQHTEHGNDERKVQMESDKFLVEIFLPERDGSEVLLFKCRAQVFECPKLAGSVLTRFPTFCSLGSLCAWHEVEIRPISFHCL